MIRLMNSAMMPIEGKYSLRRIDVEEFKSIITRFYSEIVSYIGYASTLDYIKKITGKTFSLCRQQTEVFPGDTLLICKLRYRLQNPNDKGKFIPTDDDWEYFICKYNGLNK